MNFINLRDLRRNVGQRRFSYDQNRFAHQGTRCLASETCRMAGLPFDYWTVTKARELLGLSTDHLFHLDKWPTRYRDLYKRDRHAAAAQLLDEIMEKGEAGVFGLTQT